MIIGVLGIINILQPYIKYRLFLEDLLESFTISSEELDRLEPAISNGIGIRDERERCLQIIKLIIWENISRGMILTESVFAKKLKHRLLIYLTYRYKKLEEKKILTKEQFYNLQILYPFISLEVINLFAYAVKLSMVNREKTRSLYRLCPDYTLSLEIPLTELMNREEIQSYRVCKICKFCQATKLCRLCESKRENGIPPSREIDKLKSFNSSELKLLIYLLKSINSSPASMISKLVGFIEHICNLDPVEIAQYLWFPILII